MDRARTAEALFRQRLPVATSPKHKHNPFKDAAHIHGLAAATGPALVLSLRVSLGGVRYECFNPLPKGIRNFPRLHFSHGHSLRQENCSRREICQLSRIGSSYLRISSKLLVFPKERVDRRVAAAPCCCQKALSLFLGSDPPQHHSQRFSPRAELQFSHWFR